MRIIYMGSPDFAVPSLEILHQTDGLELVGVASNPDKRRGRRGQPTPTPVKAKALELGIPTFDVEHPKDADFAEWLTSLKPDLLVVVAFRILPNEVLAIPSVGSINLHASLLPKFRGAAPIHWAVMKGEKETGATVFFLNEKMDAGQIIGQFKTSIAENETTGEVYNRLMEKGADLIKESVLSIKNESYTLLNQDHSLATPAPKIFKEDCRVHFDRPRQEVHNHIRGLSPYPGAFAEIDGEGVGIYRTQLPEGVEFNGEAAGSILKLHKKMMVACADGYIQIDEIRPPAKKSMDGMSFLNGWKGKMQFDA